MKLKIYVMHSEKINYKEEIYRPLLEKGLMKDYYLILPMSNKYGSDYIKELLDDSDIVICDLSGMNFFLKAELKIADKLNKDIYYFIKNTDKNVNKYNNIDVTKYIDKDDFANKVSDFLKSLNEKELLLKRDNIFCLGKIQK